MNIVIYARFSSHNQTEQSIEDQLRVCHEYARSHGFTVIHEYIDRAQSGISDNRADFQRMINEACTTHSKVFWSTSRTGSPETDMTAPYIRLVLRKTVSESCRQKRISPMTHRAFWSKVFLIAWRNTIPSSYRRRSCAA